MKYKDSDHPFVCYSIFYGHGVEVHKRPRFASEKLPELFEKQILDENISLHEDVTSSNHNVSPMIIKMTLFDSYEFVHRALSDKSGIKSTRSGTTTTSFIFVSDNNVILVLIWEIHVEIFKH